MCKKRFAIYTAIVGDYDEIRQPIVVDMGVDFFLFSNNIKEKRIGVWQIKRIPYSNHDSVRVARWVKTHPEILLPDYEASLWIDANIQIISEMIYSRIRDLYNDDKVAISTVTHLQRVCVYQEAVLMIRGCYERERVVIDWGHYLRKAGFPKKMGLAETGVLFRKHTVKFVKTIDSFWWWCIENYSKRDQLSFCYVLWKLGANYTPFFSQNEDVRTSSWVAYWEIHKNETKKWVKWGRYEAWLGRYVNHNPNKLCEIENLYYWIFGTCFPHFWAFSFGQLYRLKDVLSRKILLKRRHIIINS